MEAEEALFGAVRAAAAPEVAAAVATAKVAAPTAAPTAVRAQSVWDDEDDDDDEAAGDVSPVARQNVAGQNVAGQNAAGQPAGGLGDAASMTPPPLAPRRGLDESLLAVLREEADRETAVRRSETPKSEPRALESQTDLGLEETSGAASAAKAVRDRLARLRGPEPEPEKPVARRDLLPDIEEINSTLRASTENRSAATDYTALVQDKPPATTGFRSGFSLMLLFAVVLVVAYVAAPRIAEQFPAARGALTQYVGGIDAARIWLDGTMKKAIAGLQGLTGG
ncbi:hypothetical protein SAMN05216227_1001104 [Pseudorhodobacter antarcticus]|uniref:Uncharacterized protein n=2 Tax=Pseudorhodobacter antarcticus TaxID=1077947 RepID=A0A1H8AE10_9RHOB|nr:hypothetical protein SAMN05216227_1001104 [Pseudorhodobacter antarcticus]